MQLHSFRWWRLPYMSRAWKMHARQMQMRKGWFSDKHLDCVKTCVRGLGNLVCSGHGECHWSHVTLRANAMRGGLAKNAISNVLEWKQQAYRAVDMESARLTIIQRTQVVHATNNTGVLIVELDALETKRLRWPRRMWWKRSMPV